MNLLPEYHAQPHGRKFKAAFKLFEGTDWHVVPNSEPFDTAADAIEAAKEHVKQALNSRIRASKDEQELADSLGVEEWRQRKAQEEALAPESVFGDCPPVVKNASGREAPVERRKR